MQNKMEAKAYLKYLRISPRKVQIVADLIRGKDVNTAMAILMQTPKAASEPMIKLLKSAVANAENNNNMDVEKLYVSQVFATPGPILKRVMPRAQGRAFRINKRTSHVTLAVAEKALGGSQVLWDRKLTPTACAWASSRTGIPVGMPAVRRSAICLSRIRRSVTF